MDGGKRSPKRGAVTQEYIGECKALRERILAERGGMPVDPSVAETISRLREGICAECRRDVHDVAEQVEERKKEVIQVAEEQQNIPPRKVRRSRAKRIKQGTWLEEARKLREQILARRGGVPLPDSSEIIAKSREEDW